MIYSFGQFELDSRKREITCDKQLIKVQPRVYKLILLLIDNSDRAVDKNEIQDLIWPNQIVSETSLSRLVMKARKALKDSSESPQYIKTVHGFGFQCVATIIRKESKIEHNHTPVTANPEAPSSLEIKNAKEKPVFKLAHYRKLRWFVPLFITTLIIIGSVLALSYYLTPTTSVAERVVILPVINHIKDKEHNWVSLGIPSLVNTMLEQSKQVEVVDTKLLLRNKLIVKWMSTQSHSDSKTANPILTNKLLLSLKADLGATKIIYSTLEEQGDILILTYSIHQNTTQVPSYKLSANTPTQMAKLLTEKLIDTETHPIEKLATHSISVNQFVNTLYGKGQSLLLQGQTQKARDLFKVAVSEEPELFWPRYSYALTSRKLGKWKLSEQELLSLLKHPEIKMIHRAESRTRNVLGFVYYRLKQYSKALTQYDIAFKLSATENDPALQAGIADNVGAIYWIQYQFDDAREWLTKAIAARKTANLEVTGHTYNLLGLIERDQGNLLAAKEQLMKSAKLFGEAGMLRDHTMAQINLSFIDQHLGNYQQALARLKTSERSFIQLNEQEGLGFLNRRLGSVYLSMNNLSLANQHAQLALEHAKKINSPARVAQSKFLLGQISLAQEHIPQARLLLLEGIAFEDEIWAPYVQMMRLSKLEQDKEAVNRYYARAIQDSERKGDLLAKLYAESIYYAAIVIGQEYSVDKPVSNLPLEKRNQAIMAQARGLNARAILGNHLITLIDADLSHHQLTKATTHFQLLEQLHPNWQTVHSLNYLLSQYDKREQSKITAMEAFKASRQETWSSNEQRWLVKMRSL